MTQDQALAFEMIFECILMWILVITVIGCLLICLEQAFFRDQQETNKNKEIN